MENLIYELKNAMHEKRIGGIFHSIQYQETETKVKEFIMQSHFTIQKPEYFHYNSIIDWYYTNKEYLDHYTNTINKSQE
jgi:hypothetical protein